MCVSSTKANFKQYLQQHEQGLQQVSFEDLKGLGFKTYLL